MRRATKIRICPDKEQARFLDRQFGAVRFVFNKALAIRRHCYKVSGDKLTAKHDLKPLLAVAKHGRKYGWLADFDAMSLQQACINLDKAFKNFFEHRARFPRFKRKRGAQSSYHCTGRIAVGDDWMAIPKCPGRIEAVVHHELVGELKSITLSKTATIGDVGGTACAPKLLTRQSRQASISLYLDQWAATSKTCQRCGFKAAEMPLSVRNWTCSNRGIEHDRDINGACMVKHLTILKLRAVCTSLSVEACVRRATRSLWPSKQKAERCEPLEAPGFSHGEHSRCFPRKREGAALPGYNMPEHFDQKSS
jgi:hypothetical protein